MRLGQWLIQPIPTATFCLDGGAMFGVVPKAIWGRLAAADEHNRIPLATRSLLLRDGRHTVVVEPGIGDAYPPDTKEHAHYAIRTGGRTLLGGLAALGVSREAVTDVIVTHLHFDHAAALVVRQADRSFLPQFPAARVHLGRAQLEHARRPNVRDRASYLAERIEALVAQAELVLHDTDELPLFEGLRLLVVSGHTPGQILPVVHGPQGSCLFASDLVPTAAHVPVPYIMAYDLAPAVTIAEKQRILARAVAEDWTLAFFHDPRVEACRVAETAKGFAVRDVVSLSAVPTGP